ncbi:MAG: nodulation protein NfeD [Rhodospirillaceae bacterium]|nr:MAG: nodulation protein NfeD [Rhodospirillaceae bacterium]
MQPDPSRIGDGVGHSFKIWRIIIVSIGSALAALALSMAVSMAGASPRQAVVLDVDGVIGPAAADYLVRGFETVRPEETGIVILRMDTPGGLDTSMRKIIRAILASPVPVATYVAPGGARAASAGTYITYASTIAAMAPGTNLGAATPIQLGGPPMLPGSQPEQPGEKEKGSGSEDKPAGKPATQPSRFEPTDVESRKIINDAEAYIRGLADLHGRNADWAAEAVRAAVSLPASEALRLHVIDVVADDIPDLLRKIDGRTVTLAGKTLRLATADLDIVHVAPDWRTQLLTILTNPNIAYILLLLGAYGLFFEFANPGMVLPGIIGAIALLLALFAFGLLPVNYAGAGLVLLGIALMVAEAFIGSFGLIGIGGIIAFAMGSIMMFRSNVPGFGLSLSIVFAATAVTSGFFLLVLSMLWRSRRRPVITGKEALIGVEGEVVTWQGAAGLVRVQGEIWQASAHQALQAGMRIRVISREGLVLTVGPV